MSESLNGSAHESNGTSSKIMEQGRAKMNAAMENLRWSSLKGTVTHLWDNVSHKASGAWSSVAGGFALNADVTEEGDHFAIVLEVPGVAASNLEINFNNGILTVTGDKAIARNAEKIRLQERADGKFERKMAIPHPIDTGSLDAELSRGLLTIRLKKLMQPDTGECRIVVRETL